MLKKFFIWPVMKKGLLSFPKNIKNIAYELAKKQQKRLCISWTILDMALSYIDKM